MLQLQQQLACWPCSRRQSGPPDPIGPPRERREPASERARKRGEIYCRIYDAEFDGICAIVTAPTTGCSSCAPSRCLQRRCARPRPAKPLKLEAERKPPTLPAKLPLRTLQTHITLLQYINDTLDRQIPVAAKRSYATAKPG